MIMRIYTVNKVCRNMIPSTLRVSQSSLLAIAILFISDMQFTGDINLAFADREQGVYQWQAPGPGCSKAG